MPDKVDALQLIITELKDIKDNQKEMRADLTVKFGTIHKRIDDVVEARHQCELACKERDAKLQQRNNTLESQSKDRDNTLEKKIFKTTGIMSTAINGLFRFGEWIITVIIK